MEPFPGSSPTGQEKGKTANSPRYKGSSRRHCFLKRSGIPAVETSPDQAEFKCGSGRIKEIRPAAGAPVGIAARRRNLAAFLAYADILALSSKRVLETLEAKLGSPHSWVCRFRCVRMRRATTL